MYVQVVSILIQELISQKRTTGDCSDSEPAGDVGILRCPVLHGISCIDQLRGHEFIQFRHNIGSILLPQAIGERATEISKSPIHRFNRDHGRRHRGIKRGFGRREQIDLTGSLTIGREDTPRHKQHTKTDLHRRFEHHILTSTDSEKFCLLAKNDGSIGLRRIASLIRSQPSI